MERFIASIFKNNILTHKGPFKTEAEREAWLAKHIAKGTFGQNDKFEPQQVEVSPAMFGEDGELLQDAQFEEQLVQIAFQDYEVVLEDIGERLEQEAINAESEAFLKATDWMVTRFAETSIAIPEEIKQQRAAARAAIVR